MTEKFEKSIHYFKKMSTLKKVLIVFVTLFIFIIIVEQPGGDSKRRKSEKFFIPKLVIEDVTKIEISKPIEDVNIVLERMGEDWRVLNGHSLPADRQRVGGFLNAMHSLKEGALVSKNPERTAIFSAGKKRGIHVQVWNHKERSIGDFYAGEGFLDGQYLRRTNSDNIFQTTPTLMPFLHEDADGWKDKTLLSVDESDIRRITLRSPEDELILEKKQDAWHVVQPEEYESDSLAVRTLFDQLKQVRAESFVDSIEGSQIDFENADYEISVRLMDDSLNLVLFKKSDEGNHYFAKNGERNMIYSVDPILIDSIFGLEFRSVDE